jgi:hypothetical protein
MEQVKVRLSPQEYTALFRLCERELRSPADQIRHLVREALRRRRFLMQRPQDEEARHA